MMEITHTVKQLLIINIIFYVGTNFFGNTDVFYNLLSLHAFQSPDFRFWQPLTHMFMHAPYPSLSHIIFNMVGLYSFGSALEHFWGGKRFLFFYISCGLGAAVIHNGINYYFFSDALNVLLQNGLPKSDIMAVLSEGKISPTWQTILTTKEFSNLTDGFFGTAVGASGALYGVITAFAIILPNAEMALIFLPFPVKAKYFVPVLIGLDLISGFSGYSIFGGGNIAHFAHIGGAIFGVIIMWFWRNNKFNQKRWN